MCQLMEPSWSSLWQGFVSELSCRNYACRTTAEQRQLTLRILPLPAQDKRELSQTPKNTSFGSLAPNSKPKFDRKNKEFFGFAHEKR